MIEGEKFLVKELELSQNETVDSLEDKIKNLESIAIVEIFENY